MGISLIHTAVEVGLILATMRTLIYWLLNANPDSRVGKFLAYAYA